MANDSSLALDRFQTEDVAAADALLRAREVGLSVVPRPESSPKPEPAPTERQAAPETTPEPTTTNSLPTGTPAAPEKEQAAPASTETPKPADTRSAYAKDQERLGKTWQQVNAEKAAIKAERDAIASERIKLQQEQGQFQQRQQQASRNKLTPELYEQTAAQNERLFEDNKLKIAGLEAMKKNLEAEGKYTDAAKLDGQIEQMREDAIAAKIDAKRCREAADQMRKNPEVSGEALKQRNAQHLQHYTVEACKKWPELGQANSEFQKATAKAINVLRQSGLDENDNPVLRYFAAEHVAAQSAAARVPAMEKELVQARARIKELETNSTPGGGTTANPNLRPASKPQTLESEGEELRRLSIEKGGKG